MIKILTIDGGGIRGIIPGMVLVCLEEKLQKATKNPNARISDFFDFVAGTSTGGILTCLILAPEMDKKSGKLGARFSAKEAVQLYLNNGKKIFPDSWAKCLLSNIGLIDEKYDYEGLEDAMNKYLKDLKLSELLKPCLIASYNIQNRSTHFFGQHKAKLYGDAYDFYVKDVCRATSAAPSYFEAAQIKSCTDIHYALIDGGIFANNPSLCAYAEMRKSKGLPSAKDMFMVSLGTGSTKKAYMVDDIKDKATLTIVPYLIDMMMSGVADATDFQLQKMFQTVGDGHYYRIQPNNLIGANHEMDDASDANLRNLQSLGEHTANAFRDELDEIVNTLIHSKSEPLEFDY